MLKGPIKDNNYALKKSNVSKRCTWKNFSLALITVTDNNSPSFDLFLFKLTAFFLIRSGENIQCAYLALVKKGKAPALVPG